MKDDEIIPEDGFNRLATASVAEIEKRKISLKGEEVANELQKCMDKGITPRFVHQTSSRFTGRFRQGQFPPQNNGATRNQTYGGRGTKRTGKNSSQTRSTAQRAFYNTRYFRNQSQIPQTAKQPDSHPCHNQTKVDNIKSTITTNASQTFNCFT